MFHVSAALVSLVFTLILFTPAQLPWVAACFAGTFWTLEGLRRISPRANDLLMAFFAPIARPIERVRVNSATWYMTALVLLASTGSTIIAAVGVAVLGFADPTAAIVGRRFGRVKLVHGRTLEGTVTFAVVGAAAALGVIAWLPAPPPLGIAVLIAATAGTAGAFAELFSRRIDDNFAIPLVSAAAAAAVLLASGHTMY
jgi:dolichol kinase